MAAYGRVYDSRHLQADCQEPGSAQEPYPRSELSMGPFCVTRSNPTHQLTDPIQPSPLQVEKIGLNPTQPNTTNNLTAWCNQILSNRALDALIFSTF